MGVVLLQLVMTQVVTFLFSMAVPDVEHFQKTSPVGFALFAGFSFAVGAFLPGWLALKLGWLKGNPNLPARMIGTLAGAYIPLAIALLLYPVLEAGNPFFSASILAAILGFHAPFWFGWK